jgi:hypothetical protein
MEKGQGWHGDSKGHREAAFKALKKRTYTRRDVSTKRITMRNKPIILYSAISKETYNQAMLEAFFAPYMFRDKQFWASETLAKARGHTKLADKVLVKLNVKNIKIDNNHGKMRTDWIIDDILPVERVERVYKK